MVTNMDKKILKMAVAVMRDLFLTEISIKDGETEITMKRDSASIAPSPAIPDNTNTENLTEDFGEEMLLVDNMNSHTKSIIAPMIGIFHTADTETGKPFVNIGSKVKVGDTLCIIESMKMMNLIPSEYNGTITDVCISDGSLVEYGQTMFKIELNG